jgi:hypothetical protein
MGGLRRGGVGGRGDRALPGGRIVVGLAVSGLASALVLSGCSGDPLVTKTFTPTASEKYVPPSASSTEASPTPTSSSTAAAGEYQPATETSPAKNVPVPEYPQAAKANTEAGQKAFIKYWFQVFNYTTATGDGEPMKAVASKDCKFCKFTYEGARSMVIDQETWIVSEGVKPDLTKLKAGPSGDGEYPWDVPVDDASARFYDSEGESSRYVSRGCNAGLVRVWLRWEGQQWILLDYAKVETQGEATP